MTAGTRRARPPPECLATVPSQASRSRRSMPRVTWSAPRPAPRTAATRCPSRTLSRRSCAWSSQAGATSTSPPSRRRERRPRRPQGDNNTSVQFVTLDAADVATGVDFGLVIPDQVIQPDAPDRDRHPVRGCTDVHRGRFDRRPPDARRAAVVEGRQRRRRPATSPSAPNSPSSARSAQRGGSRTTG